MQSPFKSIRNGWTAEQQAKDINSKLTEKRNTSGHENIT